ISGMVKTTPAATESLADPVVWTMLFSRIDVRPRARKIVIESTAMGMEELTVSPILSARYTLEALKINPSTTPRMRARGGSSAGQWGAAPIGFAVSLAGVECAKPRRTRPAPTTYRRRQRATSASVEWGSGAVGVHIRLNY